MATTDTNEDPSRPSSGVTPGGLRSIGRLLAGVLLLFVAGAGIWVARGPLLRSAAHLWIVSDPVTHADVAVVLGGDLELRPFAAAELYRNGWVGRVLVSQVEERRSSKLLEMPGHSELNRRLLIKLGVPESAIGMFGLSNSSTQDEAVALRGWADRHRVTGIVVPTDLFSSRRVRWILDREFAGSSVRVSVPSFEPPQYTRAQWWKSEWGMIMFQNEVTKYIYYRFKY